MHNGAYATLEAVVRHYNNVDSAVKSYDVSQLAPSLRTTYHGDAVQVFSAPAAHTDGDSLVYFRHNDVIATGATVGWIYDATNGTIKSNTTDTSPVEADAKGTLYSAY